MRFPVLAAAALAAVPFHAPLYAQADLPRLMTGRSVASLPAAAPAETIAYGEGERQKIELFLPRTNAETPDALRPVVVLIHGGCWQKAVAGMESLRPAAAAFLEKGYAVWSISYRGIDEEGGGYPGIYQDVGKAIDTLRDHAEANKLDLNRVVLFGHSAGGHLALWAAGRAKIPSTSPLASEKPLKPRGVVSVGGFGSLKDWGKEISLVCGADSISRLAPGEDDARFSDTSPEMLLPSGVPVVMLHGVFDQIAYPAMGLDYAQAVRKAGDRADIQIAPVSGHFEVIAPGTAAFAQAVAAVERFAK